MRARNGSIHKNRRQKLLKSNKGYRGARSRLMKVAHEAFMRAGVHSVSGRKQKKRQYRSLWIVRINAAAREQGISYSALMNRLARKDMQINRKMLAEMAVSEPEAFKSLVTSVR